MAFKDGPVRSFSGSSPAFIWRDDVWGRKENEILLETGGKVGVEGVVDGVLLGVIGACVEHLVLDRLTVIPHPKGNVTLTFSYRKTHGKS